MISKYKAAIGLKNIGSGATKTDMGKAKAVSLGRNKAANVTSSRARGSWEGYMYGMSTPIQMNGTGYLAKSAQKARGPRPPTRLGHGNSNPVGRVSTIVKNVFDYTYSSSSQSSMSRLMRGTRLNKMF